MAAPDLAAARRASDELVRAGAGRVLLFGSLARGEAGHHSDIDLVAIYDDLGDYSDRSTRRCVLEAKAGEVAGWPVDVVVTDAPEWAVRTTRVPCSVEARIAGDAVELADTGHHTGIDWDKGASDRPTGGVRIVVAASGGYGPVPRSGWSGRRMGPSRIADTRSQ